MDEFWGLTILELTDIINSKRKAMQEMMIAKEKAEVNRVFVLAEAIATRISYIFSPEDSRDINSITQPWDYYPKLFEAEEKEAEMRKETAEQEIQRQKVIDWANKLNARRHKEKEVAE